MRTIALAFGLLFFLGGGVGCGGGEWCYFLQKIKDSVEDYFYSLPRLCLSWIFLKEEYRFSSVQSLSHVRLFETPWTAAHQASLSITNSQRLLKLMSIVLVISNYLILCRPLLLPPSIFPSIRVFSNESVLHIRWPKYWRIITLQ